MNNLSEAPENCQKSQEGSCMIQHVTPSHTSLFRAIFLPKHILDGVLLVKHCSESVGESGTPPVHYNRTQFDSTTYARLSARNCSAIDVFACFLIPNSGIQIRHNTTVAGLLTPVTLNAVH